MASSFSNLLRFEKMAKGDQNSTWGTTFNMQLELIEDAIGGQATVTHNDATTMAISALNGMVDEARSAQLKIVGTLTAERALIVPNLTKIYAVSNNTTGNFAVMVRTAAGTGVRVPNGQAVLLAVGTDGNTMLVGGLDISSLTAKTTPVDADAVPIMDSANNNSTRKLTFANLKIWISSLFVAREATIANAVNLNNAIISGMYRLSSAHDNLPAGFENGHIFISRTGDSIAQVIVAPASQRMAWRGSTLTGDPVTPTWTTAAWTEVGHRPTVSASAPSGGVDGDIWAQIV